MKSGVSKLSELLSPEQQYLTPIFQRPYSWKEDQLSPLWEDVKEQYNRNFDATKSAQPRSHFMGSIVVAPDPQPDITKPRHLLIDGQQRLTTLTVLLCAFRDCLWEEGSQEAQKLDRNFLINESQDTEFQLKLKPAPTSAHELRALVEYREVTEPRGIADAYKLFYRKIEELQEDHGEQFDSEILRSAIVNQLSFIIITCDPSDDPHQIFESLNATGLSLSQSDLIRNLLFMSVGQTADAIKLHTDSWLPAMFWMETSTKKDAAKQMDDLFWADLIRQGEIGLTRENIYSTYKSFSERKNRLNSSGNAKKEILRMSALATPYRWLVDSKQFPGKTQGSEAVRRTLRDLQTWGTQPALPLLLELADSRAVGLLTDKQFSDCCQYVLSFFVRRALCGVPSNNLNRILFGTVDCIRASKEGGLLVKDLFAELSAENAYWPTDADLIERLPELNFYNFGRGPQRRLVLDSLELQRSGKERADLDVPGISIEHVMPQTLTPAWIKKFNVGKAEAIELHQQLVHQIGNLTLTGYNGELSNKDPERKKQLLATSVFRLSDEFKTVEWTPEGIRKRSITLAKLACKVWKGPAPESQGIAGRY